MFFTSTFSGYAPRDIISNYCKQKVPDTEKVGIGIITTACHIAMKQRHQIGWHVFQRKAIFRVMISWETHNMKVCIYSTSFHLWVVQELEVAGSAGSFIHSLGQLYRPAPTLRPVVTRHSVRCSALFCNLTHQVNLCLGVCPEALPREKLVVLGGLDNKLCI